MLEQTLAIIRNTFFESIRQPIMLVVLVIATIALILCNPIAAFTMDDDQKMLIDMGLATVFLCSALLASFIATSVLNREIENRTALTVVSKPVTRPIFVIGKFLGAAGAMLLAAIYMALVFLLVEMHGVIQTVRDPMHTPVLVFGISAAIIGFVAATWCNYFYNKVFASTVVCFTTPLVALAYLLSMMFRHDFTPQPISVGFDSQLWYAITVMLVAVLVLVAIAIAASTRFGQVMTIFITLGAFLLGLLSDYLFGRRLAGLRETWTDRAREQGLTETVERVRTIQLTTGEVSEPVVEQVHVATVPLTQMAEGMEVLLYGVLWIFYAIIPNFQIMLLLDALTQGHVIPGSYVVGSIFYGLLFVIVALCLAVILFQRREVG
ncbi:MAG: hypothetical protein EA377_10355 [Phycisphaerales bacterium]|nr:MAG: hypothetical protein EA377_10355 [Phycisphaerales bacterium]